MDHPSLGRTRRQALALLTRPPAAEDETRIIDPIRSPDPKAQAAGRIRPMQMLNRGSIAVKRQVSNERRLLYFLFLRDVRFRAGDQCRVLTP
jgi:hypothetical protein